MSEKVAITKQKIVAIGDALREKRGETNEYPLDDMPQAILDIKSGGSGADENADVVFWDYNGVALYAYSKEDFLALSEMPTLPDDTEYLTAQEWNWTLEEAKLVVEKSGFLDIGCTRTTIDGKTHIFLDITEETKSGFLKFTTNEAKTSVIEWGDGNSKTITGSSGGQQSIEYTYADVGLYEITISGKITIPGANYSYRYGGSKIWEKVKGNVDNTNIPYKNTVVKVYTCDDTTLSTCSFASCYKLQEINIAKKCRPSDYSFYNCNILECIVVPNSDISACQQMCNGCYKLKVICHGEKNRGTMNTYYLNNTSIKRIFYRDTSSLGMSLSNFALANCKKLEKAYLENVATVGQNVFTGDAILAEVTMTGNVTKIDSNAFKDCNNLKKIIAPSISIETIGSSPFYNTYFLNIDISNWKITTTPSGLFYYCYSIPEIILPETLTTINTNFAQYCYNINKIVFPANLETIKNNAFVSSVIVELDFRNCQTIPTLSGTSVFYNLGAGYKIVVPETLYAEWIAATNWTTYKTAIYCKDADGNYHNP